MMGAPVDKFHNHDKDCQRRFAFLNAGRSWPPPLSSMDSEKQMLVEELYPAIKKIQPQLARKITGMILEMDITEIKILLFSDQRLRTKVNKAMRVLQPPRQRYPRKSSN